MAMYIYESVTGSVEIEIDARWAEVLQAEDIDEENAGRKHTRPDHKYAPGEPVSLDSLRLEGEWFADRNNGIEDVEFSVDLERVLRILTGLQRRYFILTKLRGYSYSEIAKLDGKNASTVFRLAESAVEKIKNIF